MLGGYANKTSNTTTSDVNDKNIESFIRTMFNGCKVIKNEGYLDVDVLLDYINNVLGGNIGEAYKNNHGDGRITID